MRATAPPAREGAGLPFPASLRVTSEGVAWIGVALVLGGVGWLKSLYAVLLLGYGMLALFGLNAWLARQQVRRVTAARVPLPPVYAGEEVRSRVRVRNTGRSPATVGIVCDLQDSNESWLLDGVPAGSEVDCTGTRSFSRRGRFGAAPPRVWSGFPFGLLRAERPGDGGGEVVVLPAVGEADPDGLRQWAVRQGGGDTRSRPTNRLMTADPADIRGVRPYRPGDSMRSVHWRTTARRGDVMVREYDTTPSPELLLVVEPWLPSDPTPGDRDRLEAALSLAATVARAWCRHHETPVTVVLVGEATVVRTAPPTDLGARELLAPLADCEGGREFPPPPPEAFAAVLGRSARVVVSSRPDSPLAAALSRSTRKPFAAVDPSLRLAWYHPPATTTGAGKPES